LVTAAGAPGAGCALLGVADGVGTNQSSGPSSIPFDAGAFGGGLGCTMISGSARIRSHSEGSVVTNGFSGSNGIESPACVGHEKGSRQGALVLRQSEK
jgi:hypothetical protein